MKKFDVIDCHVHVRGIEDLQKLVQLMKDTEIAKLNAVCLPVLLDEYLTQNLMGLLLKAQNPGKVYAFGGLFYPDGNVPKQEDEFRRQAQELMDLGFDGIKMIEGKPNARKKIGIPLSSPIYDEFYSYLEEKRVPVIFHVGDPGNFWDISQAPEFAVKRGWTYTDGTFASKEQLYREVDEILEKHPLLQIIFPHFYFMAEEGVERAASFMEKWPGISFDITPGVEMYGHFTKCTEDWKAFFIRFRRRILFGTDNDYGSSIYIVNTIRRFLETEDVFYGWGSKIKGIHLPEEVLQDIYTDNFIRYAGLHPRKVNLALCMKKLEETMLKIQNCSDVDRLSRDIDIISKRFFELNIGNVE